MRALLIRALQPACLLALLLWLIPGAATATATATVQFYDGSFECYAGTLALRLPDTYAQLLRIGQLRRARDIRRQREHGHTTTERQLEFPGLVLRVFVFSGDPGHYEVGSVRISSPGWPLSPLRVGEARSAVALGQGWPALPRQGSWEVQGDSAHLRVEVAAGRIAAIDYFCDPGT